MNELEQVKTWRRALHQIPELELELPKTAAYLKEQLAGLPCEIIELDGCGSSFGVYFDFGQEETVAFRSDMDALPVVEKTGHDFVSRHPGRMHACGHDGHMSILLGLAHRLAQKTSNPWNVLLLFQAGEETPGGAELICKTGIFQKKKVRSIFGLHLWPALPKGVAGVRAGEMMARASEIDITIQGRSAHAAKYREGIDAMEAGARLLLEIYRREGAMDPSIYRLLRFGCMKAGTVRNAVAASCVIEGSLRSFSKEVFEEMKAWIAQAARHEEEHSGCQIAITYSNGYPAVINDVELTEAVAQYQPGIQLLKDPEMIAEDFAFYQQEVPGVFFFLGTGTGIPLHADTFDFDESLLQEGVQLFEQLAQMPNLPQKAAK